MNYCIVDRYGVVQNIIVLDDQSDMTPSQGNSLVEAGQGAAIGGTYSKGVFSPAPPPVIDYKPLAQAALTKSDTTIIRCAENNVPVPEDWATYRAALRNVVANGGASLPTMPSYPVGT